jgi:hypothetical protein
MGGVGRAHTPTAPATATAHHTRRRIWRISSPPRVSRVEARGGGVFEVRGASEGGNGACKCKWKILDCKVGSVVTKVCFGFSLFFAVTFS